ncbi:vacuolar protein sorting-associated protein 11 homolog [Copidosoma floridanum]|uniref:vacuolar protein sorting-associated protein 11 homolog n=1 Tax=Copidosoma floridanum TaxID=29053 RepID=UPI000C6F58E2|nr:vacuolar protein sorting-associated protein 11 homolog [Copidosoma floridanum]
MTFFEWRRFNFFDLEKEVDSGKIAEVLAGAQVVAATSGNGLLVFADSTGSIHLVNRHFNVVTFRAYEATVTAAQQAQNSTFLFTIGEDDPGCNPTIKVWNLAVRDKQDCPLCVRISRAIPSYKAVPVSALCIHSSLTLMAVGFEDGSVMLYRFIISVGENSMTIKCVACHIQIEHFIGGTKKILDTEELANQFSDYLKKNIVINDLISPKCNKGDRGNRGHLGKQATGYIQPFN